MTRNRLLIVNADDYGLSVSTSHTIVELHEVGVVTSTSALVLAPGFAPTARLIAGHPTLGVGVHLCLVGPDPAVLSAREIPTLVGRRGQLAPSWHRLLPRLLAGRVDPADVERELTAQVEVALAHGLRPTHVDSHQHLHLWPGLSTATINVARRFAIPAVRCPESRSWKSERPPVSVMSTLLRRDLAAAGLATTERFAGLDESGKAVAHRFDRTMSRVPANVTSFEFGVHPSVDGDPERARYRWRHQGTDEAAGLSRWGLRAQLEAAGWRLGTFADLTAVETVPADPAPAPPAAADLVPAELVGGDRMVIDLRTGERVAPALVPPALVPSEAVVPRAGA